MNKYLYLYVGAWEHTPEVMSGWQAWFEVLGDRVVDAGNPLGPGREVTPDGAVDLTPDRHPAVGYTIINAASLQEAEELLSQCPIIESVRVHECMVM